MSARDNVEYSLELRYMLDYMCYLLSRGAHESVHIVAPSPAAARAAARRVRDLARRVSAPDHYTREMLRETLGLSVEVTDGSQADACLALYLPHGAPPAFTSPRMIASTINSRSYKRLLQPGMRADSIQRTLKAVRAHYTIKTVAGLYPPLFVALWAAALLGGRLHSRYYFWLGDWALRYLFTTSPTHWMWSYIVIFDAERRHQD